MSVTLRQGTLLSVRPQAICGRVAHTLAIFGMMHVITCSIAHCDLCRVRATVLGMTLSLRPCTHLDVLAP